MITNLLESSGFFETYGIFIILIAFIVIMLVTGSVRRKKEQQVAQTFVDNLKVGDKIKTYSGIYGKIIELKTINNIKVAVVETGEGKNTSFLTIDIFSIYNIEVPVIDNKKDFNETKSDFVDEKRDIAEVKDDKAKLQEVKKDEISIDTKNATLAKKTKNKNTITKKESKSEIEKMTETEEKK